MRNKLASLFPCPFYLLDLGGGGLARRSVIALKGGKLHFIALLRALVTFISRSSWEYETVCMHISKYTFLCSKNLAYLLTGDRMEDIIIKVGKSPSTSVPFIYWISVSPLKVSLSLTSCSWDDKNFHLSQS